MIKDMGIQVGIYGDTNSHRSLVGVELAVSHPAVHVGDVLGLEVYPFVLDGEDMYHAAVNHSRTVVGQVGGEDKLRSRYERIALHIGLDMLQVEVHPYCTMSRSIVEAHIHILCLDAALVVLHRAHLRLADKSGGRSHFGLYLVDGEIVARGEVGLKIPVSVGQCFGAAQLLTVVVDDDFAHSCCIAIDEDVGQRDERSRPDGDIGNGVVDRADGLQDGLFVVELEANIGIGRVVAARGGSDAELHAVGEVVAQGNRHIVVPILVAALAVAHHHRVLHHRGSGMQVEDKFDVAHALLVFVLEVNLCRKGEVVALHNAGFVDRELRVLTGVVELALLEDGNHHIAKLLNRTILNGYLVDDIVRSCLQASLRITAQCAERAEEVALAHSDERILTGGKVGQIDEVGRLVVVEEVAQLVALSGREVGVVGLVPYQMSGCIVEKAFNAGVVRHQEACKHFAKLGDGELKLKAFVRIHGSLDGDRSKLLVGARAGGPYLVARTGSTQDIDAVAFHNEVLQGALCTYII